MTDKIMRLYPDIPPWKVDPTELRKARKKKRLTARQLGALIGTGPAAVYQWERQTDPQTPSKPLQILLRQVLEI
jgi:transcriptional regulator with XRE-family HTH domain